MATKTEPARRVVTKLGEGIQQKAWTVRRGRRAQRKKQLVWMGLTTGLSAVATLGARKLASKAWRMATGEAPPVKR